jgi:nitroreductase
MSREIIDYIVQRRSVRKFRDDPVHPETLLLLLQAAMAAPTACNGQPWEFVVVTEAERLSQLRKNLRTGSYNAPAVIAVCGNPALSQSSASKRFWVQDCSAAMENLLLAAAGLDLGAVWVGVHPLRSLVRRVSEILALPEGVTPLGLAYVGHPAASPEPRTQYDAGRVHWESYGGH